MMSMLKTIADTTPVPDAAPVQIQVRGVEKTFAVGPQKIVALQNIDLDIRNQSGEPTKQTAKVMEFAGTLERYGVPILYQDESLTSVMAEDYLKKQKKPYTKADIDSHAAAIILGDFLESRYGY